MKTSDSRRAMRIGDQIMREISMLLLEEIQNPHLELVTISGVRMNKDLRLAEIFYTASGDEQRLEEIQKNFDISKNYFRQALSKRLQMRYMPDLRFARDTFLEEVLYGSTAKTNS